MAERNSIASENQEVVTSNPAAEMNTEEIVIHPPRDGETVMDYCKRYRTEQLQRICENGERLLALSEVMVNTKWREAKNVPVRGIEQLWTILQRLNTYRRFLHFLDLLRPVREELIQSLDDQARHVERVSRWCALGKIAVGLGAIGNLIIQNPPMEAFGILGVGIPVLEKKFVRSTYARLNEKIGSDSQHFSSIRSWYQQSSELEEAMMNIFPFDRTEEFVQDFASNMKDIKRTTDIEKASIQTLAKHLISYVVKERKLNNFPSQDEESEQNSPLDSPSESEQEERRLACQSEELTQNFISLMKHSKQAAELFLTLRLRCLTSVLSGIDKMDLNVDSSTINTVCHLVLAISAYYDRISPGRKDPSLPVLVRLLMNMYSMVDSISFLSNSKPHASANKMRDFKRHLESSLEVLTNLADFIRERSDGQMI